MTHDPHGLLDLNYCSNHMTDGSIKDACYLVSQYIPEMAKLDKGRIIYDIATFDWGSNVQKGVTGDIMQPYHQGHSLSQSRACNIPVLGRYYGKRTNPTSIEICQDSKFSYCTSWWNFFYNYFFPYVLVCISYFFSKNMGGTSDLWWTQNTKWLAKP